MNYNLRILSECVDEVVEICDWYDHRRPKLGDEFEASFNYTVSLILKLPKGYPSLEKNIHKVSIERFPYNIFYIMENEMILIIGVLHHSRSKKYLKKIIKREEIGGDPDPGQK